MKQITEDYVSFETAKLLKEKGFNWQQSPFYSEQDMDEWKQENSYKIPNPDYNPDIPFDSETITIVAPHVSQSLALKWLRGVHSIYITSEPDINDKHCFYPVIYTMTEESWDMQCFEELEKLSFDKPEQAVEAALLYVLKNLI